MSAPLLDVRDLVMDFQLKSRFGRRPLRAVNHVSFGIHQGSALGLVGESGSGKSTTARCIMGLLRPTSGSVALGGHDVTGARGVALRRLRGRMQMVFQDPYSSLDPRMRVEDLIAEGLIIHKRAGSQDERRVRVLELLDLVGLGEEHMRRRPASFSGGQRQRIAIARALSVSPELLVCDEPVASLDVSIQAQILNLFKRLQSELGLTILFIAHDLATVRFLCDEVAVMRDGLLVEQGTRSQIFTEPAHTFTRDLLGAAPVPNPDLERARLARLRK